MLWLVCVQVSCALAFRGLTRAKGKKYFLDNDMVYPLC